MNYLPAGGQIRKSLEGISAYNEGASLTPSGRTRFSVEQTPANFLKAAAFGQYSLPGAAQCISNLGKSQSQIIYEQFKDLKTPQEKTAKWNELDRKGIITKYNESDIKQKFIDEKLGLKQYEVKIRSLTVNDGARARRVIDELEHLDTPQEKTDLWNRYVQAKIITDQVAEQVKLRLQRQ